MEEAPLILFQLSLKHTATYVYSFEERETHPWWKARPIRSPVLTLNSDNEEDSTSFWSEIRDNLVSFSADYGFGFHDTMTRVLRSVVEEVVADNQGARAGVVSLSVEMHLFTENFISDPSFEMFGDITSFCVENTFDSRVHNVERFNLLSRSNQEVEEDEEEGKVTCAICLEDLFGDDQEEEEEVRCMKLVSCSHVFHEDCIVNWLKEKDQCPLCRHPSCLAISTDDHDQVKVTVRLANSLG